MKPVDYQRAMRYTTPSTLEALKHHGGRNDGFLPYGVSPEGFLTDQPIGIKLAEDDYARSNARLRLSVRVRYDSTEGYAVDCESSIKD